MTEADELTAFVTGRLDEWEAAALNAGSGNWYDELDESNLGRYGIEHARLHDPASTLLLVASLRAILAKHSDCICPERLHLAAIFSTHPEYQERWKP